jgi:glycosyltransferase involved in cell wall biosynthesis
VSEIGDVDDMAKNAIMILSDPILHATMKKNALERAKLFDIKKILPLYEKYYKKIVGQSWRFPNPSLFDGDTEIED